MHPPFVGGLFHFFLELRTKRKMLLVYLIDDVGTLVRNHAKKLVGGIGEKPHAVMKEFVGHRFKQNSHAAELAQDALRFRCIRFKRIAHCTVIAERVERREGHGIDRIWSDQFFDVKNVAISFVFGAGRCPKQTLGFGAVCSERMPARQAQIALIDEFGIGDGNSALQCRKARLFVRIVGACDFFIKQFVDRRVDAADKKACHARDLRNVTAGRGKRLKPRQIGLDNLLIDLLRE
jgi:hypothetical protein